MMSRLSISLQMCFSIVYLVCLNTGKSSLASTQCWELRPFLSLYIVQLQLSSMSSRFNQRIFRPRDSFSLAHLLGKHTSCLPKRQMGHSIFILINANSTGSFRIDLHSGYHQLRLCEDIPKMAFCTCYNNFEFLVMPFRLTNVSVAFMDLMQRIIRPYLDQFVFIFVNEIFIYSRSKYEHETHLRIALQLLRDSQLYTKLFKCDFWRDEVKFLGYVVSRGGISVDPTKIEVVSSWSGSTIVTIFIIFLGWPTTSHDFLKFSCVLLFYPLA